MLSDGDVIVGFNGHIHQAGELCPADLVCKEGVDPSADLGKGGKTGAAAV